MDIDEKTLRLLIAEVIRQMQREKAMQKLYIVLDRKWNGTCLSFFEKLSHQTFYEAITVIPPSMEKDDFPEKLKEFKGCGTIINQRDICFDRLPEAITVFPIVSRDVLVKAALCIGDTFETEWIQNCMAKGRKIIMLKSGIEGFTGKEPAAYRKRIQSYYKMVLDYGIEIKEDIFEEGWEKRDTGAMVRERRKVITEKEIGQYEAGRRIELKQGDIMTALAKEKAGELGIDIIKT